MVDHLLHRWLKIPYTLHVRYVQRPKKAKATILFIHGLGNTGDAWRKVIEQMPDDVTILSIDLLGFGNSPMPNWAAYNAKTQARSVLTTLVRQRIRPPLLIVGHSLGALVAVEIARRYKPIVKGLVLCSPPLYRNRITRLPRSEAFLRRMYKVAQNHPEQFMKLSALGLKYKLVNDSFNLTDENVESYMAALGSMVINQTSLEDARELTIPTTIIKPTLDPFIVARNYTRLAKVNPNITVKSTLAGHEVMGPYVRSVVTAINNRLREAEKGAIKDMR